MFLSERYESLLVELQDMAQQQSSSRLARLHSGAMRILLVTKYQSQEAIYSALDYFASRKHKQNDLPHFGESYVQDAAQRAQELLQYNGAKGAQQELPAQLELIGSLQSNKVAKAVSLFSVVHSVASVKLLLALEKAMEKANEQSIKKIQRGQNDQLKNPGELEQKAVPRLDIFLQYNGSGEPHKNGCRSYSELCHLVEELLAHSHRLCLRGLMCMGSNADANCDGENRRCFAACRELAERLWREFPPSQTESRLAPHFELSMGMSGDYREALAEGANVLRIGRLLFSV